jgi:hypothetical protein
MTNADGVLDPRWADAATLGQLGELVAEWLEGRIAGDIPFYGGPPDDETLPLVPALARLNRLGFVTEHSQPGEISDQGAQRASVSGYCEEDVAERLASVCVRDEFVVISQQPGSESLFELPITREGSHTFTIVCGREDDALWPGLNPEMRSVLLDSWHIDVCDPVWGRNDMLWPALEAAVMRSIDDVRGSLIDPGNLDAKDDPG